MYKMRIPINWINEYIIMYLNKPNDVTKAQRPSSIRCLMQLIFSSLDVNGAATDASAWNWKQHHFWWELLESNWYFRKRVVLSMIIVPLIRSTQCVQPMKREEKENEWIFNSSDFIRFEEKKIIQNVGHQKYLLPFRVFKQDKHASYSG